MAVWLPAVFGLLGTIVGGLLTIWGQRRAEARIQEQACEAHYSALATDLISFLRDRGKLLAHALAKSGADTTELLIKAGDQFPFSHFVLQMETTFPELSDHLNALVEADAGLMEVLQELSRQETSQTAIDSATRIKHLQAVLDAQMPMLAALTNIRAQLAVRRPKRLNHKKLIEIANSHSVPAASTSEEN